MEKMKSTLKVVGKAGLRRLLIGMWNATVHIDRSLFLRYLHEYHTDVIVTRFDHPRLFDWESVQLPNQLNDFCDLAFMFWLTPLNRGLLRQDIDEALILYRTVASIPQPKGVEIGRFFGASTILLALAVGHEGDLISIDIAPRNDEHISSILKRFDLVDRVKLIVKDANEVNIEGVLDFVFIDGDHSFEGAKRDHNRWGKRVKSGGYIIHHDMANARPYATQWESLAKLRQEILSKQKGQLELINEVGSISIFRRISNDFTEL